MKKETDTCRAFYLVQTIETFEGDERNFFTVTKLFSNLKDAEDYFNEQDQEFRRNHASTNDDLETEYDFEWDNHSDNLHEYWWNGTSHRRSEIKVIMPK